VISPNGNWIAYKTWVNDGHISQVWRIRRDGSDPQPLGYGTSPDWQRIVP
jgi:Tol biopolymer transport system component